MKPDNLARAMAPEPGDALMRAVALALAPGDCGLLDTLAQRDDGVVLRAVLERAAVLPADLNTPGFAGVLAGDAGGDFLLNLRTAAAEFLALAHRTDLTGVGSINFPGKLDPPGGAADYWVRPGGAIKVRGDILNAVALEPHKIGVIAVLSRELAESSAGEAAIRVILTAEASAALDLALFGTTAGDEDRPPGLLHGIDPLDAPVGTDLEAMHRTLDLLAAAVAASGANRILFVAHSAQAWAVSRRTAGAVQVLASGALPPGFVAAFDPDAVVFDVAGAPRIEISTSGTVHMVDAAPAPIATPGSPNVIAAPVLSFYQSDLRGVRLVLPATWALRRPDAAAWVIDAGWGVGA